MEKINIDYYIKHRSVLSNDIFYGALMAIVEKENEIINFINSTPQEKLKNSRAINTEVEQKTCQHEFYDIEGNADFTQQCGKCLKLK